jgi:hypothetical protein
MIKQKRQSLSQTTLDNWKHQLQQLPKWKTISKRKLFGY